MQKILVLIKDDSLCFSTYNREISSDNLNNTNIINTKNLKFTDEYIIQNLDLIAAFLNLIIIKSKINKCIINNMDIAETVLILLKRLDSISSIYFKEDKDLNYTLSSLLLENKNLLKINCFNMPEIMFYRFNTGIIETRCELLFISDFMNDNNIHTYSNLYNKDKIIIDDHLSDDDKDDIKFFLSLNKSLRRIEIQKYNKNNLLWIIYLLKEYNFKRTVILIMENSSTTKDILNDVDLFTKLNNKYNINIKIKYSKEYIDKNKVKQLNIVMLRYIIIIVIVLCLIFLGLFKLVELKGNNNLDKNIDVINEIVDEQVIPEDDYDSDGETTEEHDVSQYYDKYTDAYNDLVKINSDAVGWLKVNNTKINYPVVQTHDNSYYLYHAFDKSSNIFGWVFADYRNDMNNISKNTILYAHNMRRKELMFRTLKNVLEDSWLNDSSNYDIYFSIKGKNIHWQVFSIYTVDNTNDYLITDFSSNDAFDAYIKMVKDRSIKDFNIDVTNDDKILTLSTCFDESKHRLVVHAKMIK